MFICFSDVYYISFILMSILKVEIIFETKFYRYQLNEVEYGHICIVLVYVCTGNDCFFSTGGFNLAYPLATFAKICIRLT